MIEEQELQMKRPLLRRMREERGSAMTEFVITLPIFIMIFAGMGMLYRMNQEGLIARMHTNQILVANATAVNSPEGFVPGVGGSVSVNGFGDIVVNGSMALGMYWDSAIKARVAEAIVPGTIIKNPASPPKDNIEAITGMSGLNAPQSFSNMLLNDLATPNWDTGGWANVLASIVQTFGVAPSLAAGIRYMPIQAEAPHNYSHPWSGAGTYNPGMLQLAAPTAAHHRIGAVAASRIAMNTIEPYKACILEFNTDLCTDGNPGASTTQMDNVNAATQACADQSEVWQSCMNSCGGPSGPSWPAYPSGAPIYGCYSCNCYCEGDRPPDSCADIGGDMGVDTPPGCPGPYCEQPG